MSTFDKIMIFLGAGCTALTGTALATHETIPLWLSLVSLFVGSGALAITRVTGVNIEQTTVKTTVTHDPGDHAQ
jgi:formate-dependent nitrite reductase membrane component NrfD